MAVQEKGKHDHVVVIGSVCPIISPADVNSRNDMAKQFKSIALTITVLFLVLA
jgi:hypothetical protein